MIEQKEAPPDLDSDLPIVQRVLTSFTDAVSAIDNYSDIADRLKFVLLDDHDFSEAALERAIFGEVQS